MFFAPRPKRLLAMLGLRVHGGRRWEYEFVYSAGVTKLNLIQPHNVTGEVSVILNLLILAPDDFPK
jgi:hypothetical protein